jgi:hypothetical protein
VPDRRGVGKTAEIVDAVSPDLPMDFQALYLSRQSSRRQHRASLRSSRRDLARSFAPHQIPVAPVRRQRRAGSMTETPAPDPFSQDAPVNEQQTRVFLSSAQALDPSVVQGRRAAGRAPSRGRTPRGFASCGTSLPIFDGRAFSHNVLIGRSAAVRSFRRTFRGVAVGQTLLANRARSVGRGRPVQGDLLRRHRGLAIPCAALSVEDRVRALRLENERIGSSPTPTTKIAGVIGVPSSRPKTSANPIVAAATTVSSQPIRRSPARFQAVG